MDNVASAMLSGDFLATAVRLATPLIFAAMGGLFAERAGVLNLALEGMMSMGAFFGFIAAILSGGNIWLGVGVAVVAGGLLALGHAFLSITLRADQIVSALGLNILAAGLTGYVFRLIYATGGKSPTLQPAAPMPIPALDRIPLLGQVLFDQTLLVYVGFLLLPISAWFIYRTSWGLSLRAVGDYPRSADTLGVSVKRMRYVAVLISGALAGLGGGFLTLVAVSYYQDGLTAGRGFIAFGAIVFGKWTPLGTFVACLLFGAADATQVRLQASGLTIPYQFMVMLPYVVTLLALLGLVGRATAPLASGVPYVTEER